MLHNFTLLRAQIAVIVAELLIRLPNLTQHSSKRRPSINLDVKRSLQPSLGGEEDGHLGQVNLSTFQFLTVKSSCRMEIQFLNVYE